MQPTELYDRSGEHLILRLENPAINERRYLPLDPQGLETPLLDTSEYDGTTLSPALAAATIAFTDPEFWQHPGFHLQKGYSPTLAERLVSDLLLGDEPPGWRRSLRAKLLAAQITARFGRGKVLEWYLNSADYGNLLFGANAAAQAYLGKPASALNLSEAALLASVSDAPDLNLWDAPDIARERQQKVIQAMLRAGWVTTAQAEEANQANITPPPSPQMSSLAAQSFTQLVLQQLSNILGNPQVIRGGWKIITTLDTDLQSQVVCTSERWVSPESTSTDYTSCEAARLLPTRPVEGLSPQARLQASAVILDPQNGQLLAFAEAPSPAMGTTMPSGTGLTSLAAHQPGSLLTPFIYLTGFARGLSPASLVWDIPERVPAIIASEIPPDTEYHGPMRLRLALANDYLAPALYLLAQLGTETVWRTAQQMGLASLSPLSGVEAYRLPLRGGAITPLEAAQAYATLANGGVLSGFTPNPPNGPVTPATLLQVFDPLGNLRLDCQARPAECHWVERPVINPQMAYLLTHILSDEAARWPSLGHPNPLEIGRPVAAKLGRTGDSTDAWTIGYTPQMTIGVWVGIPEADESKLKLSPLTAAGLWHALIQFASADEPPQAWEAPPGITSLMVCETSGLLPTPECPTTVTEVFLNGYEPTHPDNLYRTFLINRQTGLLATVFTPPELVEKRVMLVIPPEASNWAKQAGVPMPPEEYDLVYLPPEQLEAHIHSPEMFTYVGGEVPIIGTASGEDFSYYSLQIGEGLNPNQWIQLGDPISTPVEDGMLITWDTRGLDGLYALRLQVVRTNQRVDTAIIQITVDNQPPEIMVLYPEDGQQFIYPQDRLVRFQAQATDNYTLAQVTFFVDGQLLATLTSPPFALPWNGTLGRHTFLAIATDRAGNQQEASITFTIRR
jgi:membrane peptidoglycan carboxypeptidase